MKFLRRSDQNSGSVDVDGAEAQRAPEPPRVGGHTAGKGRPTPKRRDAEAGRRRPAAPPPRTQREASKLARQNRPAKEERRAAAAERRAGMDAGDDRYLLPRDRGPVKAYLRDIVDSRPHLIGLFMPLAVVVLISVVLPVVQLQQYITLFCLIALVVMIGEGAFLAYTSTNKARAKFPDATVSMLGTGWYCFTRASQIRKLRVPKPRVQRGASV